MLESLGDPHLDYGSAESGEHHLRIPNEFNWPNGDRRFRIESIGIEEGAARIVVEPL